MMTGLPVTPEIDRSHPPQTSHSAILICSGNYSRMWKVALAGTSRPAAPQQPGGCVDTGARSGTTIENWGESTVRLWKKLEVSQCHY